MVKHIVLFKLNVEEPERTQVINDFCNAVMSLPQHIDVIRHIEVSRNINPAEQYDIALNSTFDTLEDVATYATHPVHVAAAGLLKGKVASRACVDYEIYYNIYLSQHLLSITTGGGPTGFFVGWIAKNIGLLVKISAD